jgi:hypothetical protein
MKKLILFACIVFVVGMTLFQSCKKEESNDPPKAGIFYSVVGKQVAFTALTKRAETWNWKFGDGESSSEMNPVHVYTDGGYYLVILTATDASGRTAVDSANLAVDLTPYVLLTGGPTAVNGKTWKLTANHTANDRLANADADFSVAAGAPAALPQGVFGLYLNMAEVYDDTYTFYFDGDYAHDTKADGAAFAGIVNQMITNGGAGIVNAGGADFGLCTGLYTPQTGATFTYVESENFAVPSVYGPGGVLTYTGVSTLDFSGTEFVGFLDHQRKVIVQEITDNSMRLVMFMAASPTYFPLNTHALVLSFEVVQ